MNEKPGYASFIDHCRTERKQLASMVEEMENKRLGVGDPITIPASLNAATQAMIAHLKAAIADLDKLIAQHDGGSNA